MSDGQIRESWGVGSYVEVQPEIIQSSNLGGVYAFDGAAWRIIRQSLKGVSHQLYSMLNWHDRMLIGHYPTGNLLEYVTKGTQLRHLENWPPVLPGVSTEVREAQTPLLLNYHTDGAAWVKHGIRHEQVIERNAHISEGAPGLWDFARRLIDDALTEGKLAG